MKSQIKSLLQQPIIHFLVVGSLLFAFHDALNQDVAGVDENAVVVDQVSLLQFIQSRNRALNQELAEDYLAQLSDENYAALVRDLVREEVLYREAKKMGLGENDYAIKRRLVQSLEYVVEDVSSQEANVSDSELVAFYNRHLDRYYNAPRISFTHVFVDHSNPDAMATARTLLAKLNQDKVAFDGAVSFGDRFPYHNNYVNREMDFVSSHFGAEFANELASVSPDATHWVGPIGSQYGLHLVLVAGRDKGGVPPLDAVRDLVHQDAVAEKRRVNTERYVDSIIKSYKIVRNHTVNQRATQGGESRVAHY